MLLIAAGSAHACVNIEGVTQEGTYEMVSGQSHVDLLRSRMQSEPASKLATLFGGPEDHYELELKLVTRPEEQEVDAVRDILDQQSRAHIYPLSFMGIFSLNWRAVMRSRTR